MPVTPHKTLLTTTLVAALVAGCASTPAPRPPADTASADARTAALVAGDCDQARTLLDARARDGGLGGPALGDAQLETAYVCLTAGDADAAQGLLTAYLAAQPAHASRDYGRYLDAITRFALWREAPAGGDPAARIAAARELFGVFTAYLRDYPASRYREPLRPYLAALREAIAEAELTLAGAALEQGRVAEAVARANYVVMHYAETESMLGALALAARGHEQLGDTSEAEQALRQLESLLQVRPSR